MMTNLPFSGPEKRHDHGPTALSERETKFLSELEKVLWQRFRQTLPEMLSDLYKQSTISTPDLSVEGIIKELSKISSVHDVIAPLLKKYGKDS